MTDYTKQPARHLLSYDGTVGDLYAIFFKNLLLTALTFGIYRFWGISNMRRYVWSHMRFQHERFEYTGTGGELFKGVVLAIAAVVGACLGATVLSAFLKMLTDSKFIAALPIVALVLLIAVWGAGAQYSAQRYRLSRTRLRGIHGGMTGSAFAYGFKALVYGVACIFSLYQLIPWMTVRLAERRINAASFGDRSFSFAGQAGKLYGSFVLALLGNAAVLGVVYVVFLKPAIHQLLAHAVSGGLTAPIVGQLVLGYIVFLIGAWLISCWYFANLTRHIVGNTRFGGTLEFESTVTAASTAKMIVGNLLILVFTLGLGYPLVLQRGLRYTAETLLVRGELDPASLHDSTLTMPKTGEGMLNVLDHGSMV